MKTPLILFLILLTLYHKPLRDQQIDSLCDLIVDWGILEHNHPLITSNSIDSDSLFCCLVNSIIAKNFEYDEEYLLTELHQLCLKKNVNDSLFATYHLKNKFSQNRNYRYPVNNSLNVHQNNRISYDSINNQLIFPNPLFISSSLPEVNQRILAIANIWNRFKSFYPNHYFIQSSKQSHRLLNYTIDEAINSKSLLAYHLCILKLCSSFYDGHSIASSFILDSYFGIRTAPIKVRFLKELVVVNDIYPVSDIELDNIQVGDQIIEVNGCQITNLFRNNRQFVPCSNESSRNRDLANLIPRTNKRDINFKILRNKKEITVTLPTYKSSDLLKEEYNQLNRFAISHLNDSIVYIICKFADSVALDNFFETQRQIKWIIFDMRSSTKWILPIVSKYLVKQKTIFAYYSYPLVSPPSKVSDLLPLFIGPNEINTNYISAKPIILVNENTQSQGEFQTMALQQIPGALTIGSQTAGTDGNVSSYLIPGSIKISMTTIRILYPDFSETQNCGVKIDFFSRPTVDDLIQSRDPELDLALRIIQHGTSGLKKYNNRRPVPVRLH